MRVPWTARRSNQSLLQEIIPEYHWKDYAKAEAPILWPPDGKNYIQSPSCLRGLNEIMIGNNNGTFYMPESVLDAFIFKLCK